MLCRTPTPGKRPVNITRWKYEAVRRAILAAVPEQEPGIPFKELSAQVGARLKPGERERLGSIGWYTTSVKLDLEVRGEIRRVAGITPQRLVRAVQV